MTEHSRRIAGNFIDRADITRSLRTWNAPTTMMTMMDYVAELFRGPRHLYAIKTTSWMTCNRVSRLSDAAAAAASFLCRVS